jgi:prepilin-type N-terminal cleavage/methylation domain-containing protein
MRHNGHAGITLTEMMVAMAIFTVLTAGIYSALYIGNISWAVQDISVNVHDQARRAIGKLTRDLRVGRGVTINETVAPEGTTIDVYFSRTGEGNITYDWTTVEGDTQNQLIRTDDDGAVIVAQDISALSFTETANDIKINLTVSAQTNQNQTVNYSIVGNIARR